MRRSLLYYTPIKLAQLKNCRPKVFPKGLVQTAQIVYEYNPKELKSAANPFGVGKSFGQVADPFGDTLQVKFWGSKSPEAIAKKHCRMAPVVGTQVLLENTHYELTKYSAKGAALKPSKRKAADAAPKAKKKKKSAADAAKNKKKSA